MDSPDTIRASWLLVALARMVAEHAPFWIRMGDLETRLLGPDLASVSVEKPVYVCGLARAGSTVLLEALASRPDVATHRYQDFPFLFTPYGWNTLLKWMPRRTAPKRERTHGDGILVNAESPEAMEEMLWMAFFPYLHEADCSEVLDAHVRHFAFESFYTDHIRKLLLTRRARRYVTKGNYNVTRMGYLHHLFPEARFIVPIRDPVSHIASLMRQHARFSAAGKKDPRIQTHMSLAGHFEFGLNRVPIHAGDRPRLERIEQAWERGEEALGWALYWDMIYRFVYHQLMQNRALAKNTLVLPYEELCDRPAATLRHLFSHSELAITDAEIEPLAAAIRAPDYYRPEFSDHELDMIHAITGETAGLFGYEAV